MSTIDLDDLCRTLHDAYEDAARHTGWQTQESTRVAWHDLPQANQDTMREAVAHLMRYVAERLVIALDVPIPDLTDEDTRS